MKRVLSFIAIFFTACVCNAAETESPNADALAVVVCAEEFRTALEPLLEYRRSQGYAIDVVSNAGTAVQIRDKIRQLLAPAGRRFILLVGDACIPKHLITKRRALINHLRKQNRQTAPDTAQQAYASRCIPTHYAPSRLNVLWGGEPHIAADSWYADLDYDGIPDAAVGRLTPDTPRQLEQIVKKIIDYERSADFGPWRRRLNFVAGVGGFGLLADAAIESVTRHFLTHGIPAGYRVNMTYGNWHSPYCPDPRRFHETTVERLNEGSSIWVYIGHGREEALDRIRTPKRRYHILSTADMTKLKCARGAPIAIFLACYTGGFDLCDCLAEEMLRTPGAPVAVIAGSRVTMPYGMSVLVTGIMDECFGRHAPTLGEAFLAAQRKLVSPDAKSDNRKKLDSLAAAMSPTKAKLDVERLEHLCLFNIIGDPMLRMRYPKPVALDVPATADSGNELQVSGTSPVAGRATVELIVRRDRFIASPFAEGLSRRSSYPTDPDDLSAFQNVYEKANDRRLHTAQITVPAGQFQTSLKIPASASGPCHVRIFVYGEKDFALGSANLTIKR